MRYSGGDPGRRPFRPSRGRRAALAVSAVVGVALAVPALAATSTTSTVNAQAPAPAALDGTTSSSAGGSCWEIKQVHPASADGVYWLRTSTLQRPERFYCDMTTDGGGWVLIGRGRQGWTFRDYGQNTVEAVRSPVTGPDVFSPSALSTELIDGLLDGGAVRDLPDGVRVRRAGNANGTTWQDVRWYFSDLESWSWAIGGGHHLASFTIDGTGASGSNTKDSKVAMSGEVGTGNRSAKNERIWYTYPWSGHNRQAGFSYGGSVSGSNNSTSFLWEYATENNAIPFTQVFIRPRVATAPLDPIGDQGLPEQTIRPQLDDRPAELAGGVAGVLKVGDTEPQLDAPVLAITTIGDRVYVGGKFSEARDTATGSLVSRPYLAAFDRTTGAWIPSFAPSLDGTVWDLDSAGGRLIVAGQFTNVDGVPGTAALAALDPVTGAVDPTWRASMTVAGTTDRPMVRALDVEGDWIYAGGNFTNVAGATVARGAGRLIRVAVANGDPDSQFTPNVGGVPYDVNVDSGRVYVVGTITSINGAASQGSAVLDASTGTLIPGMGATQFTSATKQYQQAVLAVGSDVWQGGSEHNTHVYAASDYSLVERYVAADQGGDIQTLSLAGTSVFTGSHGNAWIYKDGSTWPRLDGYTRVDIYNWIGAFDTATHRYDKSFVPSIRSANTEGAWALHTDADGCLWFGGDFNGGPFVGGTRQYLEGFSKFCPQDSVAPTVPRNPSAKSVAGGGVQVRWSSSSDTTPGYLGYEILRNDRVVSGLVYGSTFIDPTGVPGDRYFVRAIDAAGNRSATTPVTVASDEIGPTAPTALTASVLGDASVDLTWTASIDDGGVAAYRIIESGQTVAEVPGTDTHANVLGLGVGTHVLSAQAVDTVGNLSARSDSVTVEITSNDTQPPTTPGAPSASYDVVTKLVTVTWTASTDNVSVANYLVREGGADLATLDPNATSTQLDLPEGAHILVVVASDGAGNESAPTSALPVDVVVPDTTKPTTPKSPTAVANPDGSIAVAWTASTDNVGVAVYRIYRNGVEVVSAPGTATTATITGLASGKHYIQVQAFDTAGNASNRTASVIVTTVATVDSQNPTTPKNLVATVDPDGSIEVTWSASTDNVGVASYTLFRNGVVVASIQGGQTSTVVRTLGAGKHYLQLQAVDAAGNVSYKTPSTVVTVDAAAVTSVATTAAPTTATPTTAPPTTAPPTTAAPTTVAPTTVAPATTTTPSTTAAATGVPTDTSRPTVPKDVAVVAQPDGSIDVTWTASRDNIGVATYTVTRNRAVVAVVPGTDLAAKVVGLGPGTHYIQLFATDAAGNESIRTASVVVTL